MLNRSIYIQEGRLKKLEFNDWKYYLHYGLTKEY